MKPRLITVGAFVGPMMLVVVIATLAGRIGFAPIAPAVLLVNAIGLLAIVAGSSLAVGWRVRASSASHAGDGASRASHPMLVVASGISVLLVAMGVGLSTTQAEVQLHSGVPGHLLLVAQALVLIGWSGSATRWRVLALACFAAAVLVGNTKYYLFQTIVVLLIGGSLRLGSRAMAKRVVVILLVSVPIFFGFYAVDRARSGASISSTFSGPVSSAILRHNLFYATSGILGGVELDQIDVARPCLPVFPVYLLMDGCDAVYEEGDGRRITDERDRKRSNVSTLFGAVGTQGGLVAVVVVGLMLGFVATTAVGQALRGGRDSTVIFAAVMLIPLLFGWFSNYLGLSSWTELAFWCLVFSWVARISVRRRPARMTTHNGDRDDAHPVLATLGKAR